jgi:transposase
MAQPLLDDALWQVIEPLLPAPKRRRKRHPGRKPLEDRTAVRGLLFVLRSGIAWEDFPCEMGCCGMTLLNRLRRWQRAGVWDAVHRALLGRLRAAGRIDLSRAIVDSASVRATHGGKKRARAPWTAGKTAPSTT